MKMKVPLSYIKDIEKGPETEKSKTTKLESQKWFNSDEVKSNKVKTEKSSTMSSINFSDSDTKVENKETVI